MIAKECFSAAVVFSVYLPMFYRDTAVDVALDSWSFLTMTQTSPQLHLPSNHRMALTVSLFTYKVSLLTYRKSTYLQYFYIVRVSFFYLQ